MTGLLSPPTRAGLEQAGLEEADVVRVVSTALAEDLRYGPDVTTDACVPPGARTTAVVRVRSAGVLAGLPVAEAVLDQVGAGELAVRTHRNDGQRVGPGDVVLTASGPAVPLLRAERTLLNLLCHLSGVATETRRWVDAVAGTGAAIRDTRKTLPGLRLLQKYAARCGGGTNHRLGLGDAALVKDNHVASAGGVRPAIHAVRAHAPGIGLEVECDTVEQVREALDAGARNILLDNMSLPDLRASVAAASTVPGVTLEASGGLTLDRARAVAETGVHYLAVGALTHSAPALDLALDLD